MAVFSELSSSLSLDSSDFKKGLKSASGAATSFSATTSSAFDSVDDEASAASRAINRVSRAMDGVARSATTTIVPVNRAAGAIDNAGDEASGTSRAFGVLSLSASGLSASFGILTASATSLAGALALITIALTPLLGVLATATAAFGAIAAIFGVILGSGIAAYMKQTGTTIKSLVKTVKQAVISFGKQFVPLIKDAVALLPSFIKRISQAVGSLDPFVKALRVLGTIAYNVIPPLIGLFFDLAKAALPFFIKAAKWIGKNLVPALRALFKAGQRAAGEVYRLAKGLFNVAKSLAGLAGWIGRFVVALYDLAAAALGVGKLTKELKRVGQVIKTGLQGAFNWLSTTGVKLAKKAFGFVADAALAAFKFTKKEIVPAVKSGLAFAWNWLRTKGVKLAKKAFGFLADKALDALEFTKKEIIPAISNGLSKAWNWLRTKGKKKAKKAFDFLADKAIAAFKFTKKEVIPKVADFVKKVTTWIRTKGKKKLQSAMKWLAKKGAQAFKTFGKTSVRVTRTALRQIGGAIRTHAPKLYTVLRGIGKTLTKIWRLTVKDWVRTVGKYIGLVVDIIRGVGKGIMKVLRPVLNRVSKLWKRHGKDIKLIVKTMAKVVGGAMVIISEAIRLMVKTVTKLLRGFVTLISKLWNAFGDEIVAVVRFFVDMSLSILGAFIDMMATTIRAGMAIIKGDWKKAWKLISGFVGRILDGILDFTKKWGSKLVDWIVNALDNAFDAFVQWGKDLIFGSLFKRILNAIINAVKNWNLFAAIDKALSAAWKRVHKFGVDSLNTIKNFFGDIINYFQGQFLTDVVSALSNAARQAWQAFKNTFNSLIPNSLSLPSVSVAGHTFGGGSIALPSLDVGGTIQSDGLFYGHAGERVVPAGVSTPYDGSGGGSQNVTVVNEIALDADATEDLLRGKTVETIEDLAKEAARRDARLGGGR